MWKTIKIMQIYRLINYYSIDNCKPGIQKVLRIFDFIFQVDFFDIFIESRQFFRLFYHGMSDIR